ncbi:glycosyltransferase family 2 protein [Clostridium perfringens]|uniref:glycosyltransferase family 2 protein n=1 Tax=Clostridium perfringens TaxID=1502 RepID=UPI0018E40973|nr:glycosyltransferase family 2 protein [Clostridium perfringens]MBI6036996.1 glycosyltransferase family 2 protein [Clostridium perfringens]MDK0598014.1 glycosyltransferase family 2 protein [Clostridium perfringens]MDK0945224.1 glycosyltransferase family 2 protein [Clostridium perfringens]MDK0962008.1 glycosyltransferase family 2 protein [Clostridium perfringens]MDK0970798.1 glycosyltransferase family 2 protein [Clostridium perfringens]
MEKVSVIVPTYNMEKYIFECINSISNQTYTNLEIIVVIDGATDNTQEIINNLAICDKRIKVIYQENSGSGIARNNGLSNATGKYIMFVDSDDSIEKDMVESLVSNIESSNVDLVICGCNLDYYDGDKIYKKCVNTYKESLVIGKENVRSNFLDYYIKGIVHGPVSKLFKRDIIEKNKIRFPNLKRSQDIIFNNQYYSYINSLKIIESCYYNVRVMPFENVKVKLPNNYYKVCLLLDEDLSTKLNRWNVSLNCDDLERISTFLIVRIGYCFEAIVSNMGFSSSKIKIREILGNKRIIEAASTSKNVNLYQKILNKNIVNKNILLIIMLSYLRICLRKFKQ